MIVHPDSVSKESSLSFCSMASAWSEEETFVCSVCLDTLTDPATLPCGHSYCLACIQSHWDKKDNKGEYNCPQCRQVFSPRPSLSKSTVLVEAMAKLRASSLKQYSMASCSAPPSMPIYLDVLPDGGLEHGNIYPQLPAIEPRPCPQHNQPLNLFCHEDKECVCEVCCQDRHKGHRVLKPQEERGERQVRNGRGKYHPISHIALNLLHLQQANGELYFYILTYINLKYSRIVCQPEYRTSQIAHHKQPRAMN